jgi:predicted amidohydrolase YtcJ
MRRLIEQSINPICTVEELIDHLTRLVEKPSTTYIGLNGDATMSLALNVFEVTLSDGSTVIDIDLSETV